MLLAIGYAAFHVDSQASDSHVTCVAAKSGSVALGASLAGLVGGLTILALTLISAWARHSLILVLPMAVCMSRKRDSVWDLSIWLWSPLFCRPMLVTLAVAWVNRSMFRRHFALAVFASCVLTEKCPFLDWIRLRLHDTCLKIVVCTFNKERQIDADHCEDREAGFPT